MPPLLCYCHAIHPKLGDLKSAAREGIQLYDHHHI